MRKKTVTADKKIKIAKFLAECGVGSRRRCEELVELGKVRINKQFITNVAERVDPEKDIVEFRGKILNPKSKIVFALNKPAGIVSTLSDPHAEYTITDLIPAKFKGLGLKPVGRLDRDSEGLMLLTNDGELANRLTHPKYKITKVYQVKLDSEAPERILGLIEKGVRLPNGEKLQPVGVKVVRKGRGAAKDLELTLKEGRKREIRRMFRMFGLNVVSLRRVAIGPIYLGQIKKGEMLKLGARQVKQLRDACGL